MKRTLLALLLVTSALVSHSQITYYWVGGAAPLSIHTPANWNTALNGSGTARPSATGGTDILVFDGSNIGGSVPATGLVSGPVDGGITCAQLKFQNGANVRFGRSSGTGTITLNGDGSTAEDFVVEAGCNFSISSTTGSVRIALVATSSAPANSGRVSGNLSMVSSLQARIDNASGANVATLRFTSGSTMTTNITATSASYAFGNSTQSTDRWVTFEAGSDLYYEGGYSPNGSGAGFSAIDMKPGSTWHHRATNTSSTGGNFFNRRSYGNISVENNATLLALGPIYGIDNLTVAAGSTFTSHTSGQTVVFGDLTVNGTYTSDPTGTNELVLGGSATQTVSGSGTIGLANLTIGAAADVVLNKSVTVAKTVNVYGKLDFTGSQFSGAGSFGAVSKQASTPAGTGNLTAGNYYISGNASAAAVYRGFLVTGTGIAPNTTIVSFSATGDSIYLSKPITTSGTGIALSVSTNNATLKTASTGGFDATTGSVILTGGRTYWDGINYVINAATTTPFGISSTGVTPVTIAAEFVDINANVTVNRGVKVSNHFLVNGKLTLRPLDTIYIQSGATITGTFGTTKYIATGYNSSNGDQSIVRYEGLASSATIPIGTTNYYLPATLNPAVSSNFTLAVFEGITSNGQITGTPLSAAQKQNVVNAVWNINRLSGSGNSSLQLGWNAALEGSTFATLPNSDIGLIANTGSSWALPIGTGDNTNNTVTGTVSSFGAFSAGAVPPSQPFVFNPLPVKTYGNADFNGGAFSLNTTEPIIYTSSNPAVATIVSGNIHITGAGTSVITASQASDGFYPPASVNQPLTVNKAPLTITADNKTKFEGQANPTLTATYNAFVLGETPAVLLTPLVLTTTATQTSAPGNYPIVASGATSNNYTITFVNGTLTIQPKQNQTITFPAPAVKTYGNPDFAIGATSTNSTIPITYTSSNTAVATIVGNNIHITGAGTSTITASQAGNAGFFPAPDVARTLTVNKAALTVRVRDTTKVTGQPNPPFTLVYTGFVLGETVASLTTAPTVSTIATTTSSPGVYALTPENGVSTNYSFTYTPGKLTVLPLTGTTGNYINAFLINSNTITVRIYSTEPKLGDIILYDMSGKPLKKKNIFMPVGFISTEIDIPTVSGGIYVIRVKGDGIDLKRTIPIIR